MANGSTSSRHRMKKLTDKVLKTDIPMNQKVKSKPAADILGDTHYKGVAFATNNSDLRSDADKQKMLSWSNADRQELNARENISKAKKHQQHPLFTAQGAMDFEKKGQLDRYERSDHSSKIPNNPENEKYYTVDTSGTTMDPNVSHSPDPKPLSNKVKRFHKRETRREQRILKKANKNK